MISRAEDGRWRRWGRGGPGFSLLELLVVLIMLGVLAAMAVPSTSRYLDSLALRRQTAKIMAIFRYARLRAVTQGKAVEVTLVEGESGLQLNGVGGGVSESKDFGLSSGDRAKLEPESIIFFPEGRATPATLTFSQGQRRRQVIIDPLSGLPLPQ